MKKDLFGEIWLLTTDDEMLVLRDTQPAQWWIAWLARALLRREATALAALSNLDIAPKLRAHEKRSLTRTYLPGEPLYVRGTRDPQYFKSARRLLRDMHRAGVVHNDLAKEPNLLIRIDGTPAFVDFQLACNSARRGWLFRIAAREDIRHLLKHKRTYRPDLMTARENKILDTPTLLSRIWMSTFKPLYVFVTRKIFGWADREGARDRGWND